MVVKRSNKNHSEQSKVSGEVRSEKKYSGDERKSRESKTEQEDMKTS